MRIILLLILFIITGSNQGFATSMNKKMFEEAVNAIKERAFYKLSDEDIYEAALSGVLSKLNNPNDKIVANELLSPPTGKDLEEESSGEISGIGVVIELNSMATVKQVIKGSAAESAGLLTGDYILKIDDAPVNKMGDLLAVTRKIRGPVGSKIKLTILRDSEVIVKNIRREKLPWESVETNFSDSKIGYIKISYFNQKTPEQMKKALQEFTSKKLTKCIIDLRDNSGGLFDEGVDTLKLFAKKGQLLFKIKRGSRSKMEEIIAQDTGMAANLTLAILVNGKTRSMGEIFTVALRDIADATIFGENTAGKASIETIYDLSSGHKAKFTVGMLFDSHEKTWQGVGVTPDMNLSQSDGSEIMQVKKFLNVVPSKKS